MSKKILLIDDSITIHRVIDLSIDDAYDVQKAFSPEEANSRLEKFTPDIILLDNKLDNTKIDEFISDIKHRVPKAKLVLLVGAFDQFDETDAQKLGADAYLVKPFNSASLEEMLESLGDDEVTEEKEADFVVEETVQETTDEAVEELRATIEETDEKSDEEFIFDEIDKTLAFESQKSPDENDVIDTKTPEEESLDDIFQDLEEEQPVKVENELISEELSAQVEENNLLEDILDEEIEETTEDKKEIDLDDLLDDLDDEQEETKEEDREFEDLEELNDVIEDTKEQTESIEKEFEITEEDISEDEVDVTLTERSEDIEDSSEDLEKIETPIEEIEVLNNFDLEEESSDETKDESITSDDTNTLEEDVTEEISFDTDTEPIEASEETKEESETDGVVDDQEIKDENKEQKEYKDKASEIAAELLNKKSIIDEQKEPAANITEEIEGKIENTYVSPQVTDEQIKKAVAEVLNEEFLKETIKDVLTKNLEKVVWEIIPDLAEKLIIEEIEKLKKGK